MRGTGLWYNIDSPNHLPYSACLHSLQIPMCDIPHSHYIFSEVSLKCPLWHQQTQIHNTALHLHAFPTWEISESKAPSPSSRHILTVLSTEVRECRAVGQLIDDISAVSDVVNVMSRRGSDNYRWWSTLCKKGKKPPHRVRPTPLLTVEPWYTWEWVGWSGLA